MINIKSLMAIVVASMFVIPFAHAENNVLVTHAATNAKAKLSGSELNLDIMSDGHATAFQFLVTLPKGVQATSLTSCGGSNVSGFIVQCRADAQKSKVAVVGYSPSGATLPSGVVELGNISLSSSSAKFVPGAVSKVLFSGSNGAIPGEKKASVVSLAK